MKHFVFNGTTGDIRGRLAACGGYVPTSIKIIIKEVSPDDDSIYTGTKTKAG